MSSSYQQKPAGFGGAGSSPRMANHPGGRGTSPASPPCQRCSPVLHAVANAPKSDMTAGILKTVLSAGVAGRLRAHKNIHVDVRSTASSLLEGVFGGMSIKGQHWETPLSLTANTIEVDLGELLIDYGALITKSKLALRNLPTGSCKLRLSSSDLGNFMSHPLLKPVSSKAVQGKAFEWDSASIHIGREDSSGLGFVDFEGVWEHDGGRYKVRMIPTPAPNPAASNSLRVSARRIASRDVVAGGVTTAAAAAPAAAHTSVPLANNIVSGGAASSSRTVAQGLAQMFTHLSLNLQGIELSKPGLTVILEDGQAPMLEIGMKMRIRSLPPLDMQF